MCVATDSYNGWCHRHQNRSWCSRPDSRESVIFFVFLIFIIFTLRLLCWICICMQWTDAADDGCGGRLDFAPMHAATQVMLGVSLRARWDTTLVFVYNWTVVGLLDNMSGPWSCQREFVTKNTMLSQAMALLVQLLITHWPPMCRL